MKALVAPFSNAELLTLVSAAQKANLTEADLAVLGRVVSSAGDDLNDINRILAKVRPTPSPRVQPLGFKTSCHNCLLFQ